MFFLSRGRSFRTSKAENLVRHGAEGFLLSGQAWMPPAPCPCGLARTPAGLEARVGGAPAQSLAQLAERVPVQLLDSSAHQLIEGGPRHRRQFLDWGVFHVEPSFLTAWRRYQRALKQRNTLLRQQAAESLLKTLGAGTGGGRPVHGSEPAGLPGPAGARGPQLGPAGSWGPWISSSGICGAGGRARPWKRPWKPTGAVTGSRGLTQTGPHRAEMTSRSAGCRPSSKSPGASRRCLAGALLLAQAAYLHQATGRQCVLLLDDLAAELDASHLGRFLELVQETEAQVFLTSVEAARLPAWTDASLFHVEHGKIAKLV